MMSSRTNRKRSQATKLRLRTQKKCASIQYSLQSLDQQVRPALTIVAIWKSFWINNLYSAKNIEFKKVLKMRSKVWKCLVWVTQAHQSSNTVKLWEYFKKLSKKYVISSKKTMMANITHLSLLMPSTRTFSQLQKTYHVMQSQRYTQPQMNSNCKRLMNWKILGLIAIKSTRAWSHSWATIILNSSSRRKHWSLMLFKRTWR